MRVGYLNEETVAASNEVARDYMMEIIDRSRNQTNLRHLKILTTLGRMVGERSWNFSAEVW